MHFVTANDASGEPRHVNADLVETFHEYVDNNGERVSVLKFVSGDQLTIQGSFLLLTKGVQTGS